MMLVVAGGLLLLSACPGPSKDKKPPGDPCTGSTDCADAVCHKGTCALPQPKGEGEACAGDHACKSYRCEGKVCLAGNTADGATCLYDEECARGRCECTTKACAPEDKVCRYEGPTPDGGGPDGHTPDGLPPREDAGPKPDGPVHDTLPADTLPADTQPPKQDLGCSSAAQCDDGNDCTVDSCNPTTKQCENTPTPNVGCDDKNACTHTDTCDTAGVCQGVDYSASCQGSLCETATCDGQGGCNKTLKADWCLIGTTTPTCAQKGAKKPGDSCQACDPAQSPTDWSFIDGPGCLKTLVKTGGYNDGPLGSATFNDPRSITVDDAGKKLYVLDTFTWQGKVRSFDLLTGEVKTIVGPPGQTAPTSGASNGPGATATFYAPKSIAFDPLNKRLYVADYSNCLLRMVDLNQAESSPGFVTTAAGLVGQCGVVDGPVATAQLYPWTVAVDSMGRVLIGEHDRLRRYDPLTKTVTTLYTGTPPNGKMALIDDDTVFALRGNYYSLWTIDIPTASVHHFAGLNEPGGCLDGPAATAKFQYVSGPSVYGSGASARVFLGGDQTTLREISAGQVTTLAGVCGQAGSTDGGATARLNAPFATAVSKITTGATTFHFVYLLDGTGLRRYRLP